MTDGTHLGMRLATLREALGLEADELASLLHVDASSVLAMEDGTKPPTATQLEALSDLYGLPTSVMLSSEGETTPSWKVPGFLAADKGRLEAFKAIAKVNRIALNLMEMHSIEETARLA